MEQVKWGMTLEQVNTVITYPLERDTYFLMPGTPRYVLRTAEPFKLLDIPVRANFSFSSGNKLVSITIRVESVFLESTPSQSELFGRFKQGLASPTITVEPRFGASHRRQSGSNGPNLRRAHLHGLTYDQIDNKSTELEVEGSPALTLRTVR